MEHLITKLLHDFEQGKMNRRQLIQSLALLAPVASAAGAASVAPAGTGLKAVEVNHITFEVRDYAKTRDFYTDLFGMSVSRDKGNQCQLHCGDTMIIPTNRTANTPRLEHIAIGVEPWENPKVLTIDGAPTVAAELKARGIELIKGGNSVNIRDPEGFHLQIVPKSSQEG